MLNQAIQSGFVIGILSVVSAASWEPLRPMLDYGKTLKISSKNPLLDIYVPKQWFIHFYLLSLALSGLNYCILQYLTRVDPAYISMLDWWCRANPLDGAACYAAIIAMSIHSLRRTVECTLVSKFSDHSKIHVSHYLVGIFFYAGVNLTVTTSLIVHCIDQRPLFNDPKLFFCNPINVLLMAIFLVVQYRQFCHHKILSKTIKYNHPQGGLFCLVSSPHYFDEILIYLIINLLVFVNSGVNITFVLVEIWIIVNLSTSAINTHNFYRQQKSKHPKSYVAPYAIIPYVL